MMNTSTVLWVFMCFLLFSACGTKKHPFISKDQLDWRTKQLPTAASPVHILYLIGDVGKMDNETDTSNYTVQGMAAMMDLSSQNASVVYLGDNIYPIGLVSQEDSVKRALGEKIIYAQLNPLKTFAGKTYVIPGNHDWNRDRAGGLAAIQRQENYIENTFGNSGDVHFYPDMGCGDPKVVKINREVVYIFVDSQWWLQNWNAENEINQGCDIHSRKGFLKRIEELFVEYKDKEIICMLHHPIKSNGNHGGYFSLRQHLFPLAELGIWIPLPIVGSLYPIYRKVIGSTQDNTNIHNQNLTRGLQSLAKKHDIHIIFASGHEHGLMYYETPKIKYIVSGSGAKTSYIQSGGEVQYARQARGFARILFYENFESWLEFYTVDGYDSEARLEYRTRLRSASIGNQ